MCTMFISKRGKNNANCGCHCCCCCHCDFFDNESPSEYVNLPTQMPELFVSDFDQLSDFFKQTMDKHSGNGICKNRKQEKSERWDQRSSRLQNSINSNGNVTYIKQNIKIAKSFFCFESIKFIRFCNICQTIKHSNKLFSYCLFCKKITYNNL